MGTIYVLKNTINKKCYVGQTGRFLAQRFSWHRSSKNNSAISSAIHKYGWDRFERFVFFVPNDILNELEIEMIRRLNSILHGYNLTDGGDGGWHHTENVKKKMSKRMRGPRNPNFGKIFSEEHVRHLKESHLGINHRDETKEKIRASTMGSGNHAFGKSKSLEQRKKISESKIGQHRGDTWILLGGKRIWMKRGTG
jgi:group I intron endonuclease